MARRVLSGRPILAAFSGTLIQSACSLIHSNPCVSTLIHEMQAQRAVTLQRDCDLMVTQITLRMTGDPLTD